MVTIRPYNQKDCEVFRSLVLCLHETLRSLDADLAPGDQIIDRYFQELIAKVESTAGAVFLAEDDSGLVGYVCLWGCVSPEDLDERPDPFSFMAELFVRPECRNLGVGRSLVERAERYAAQCGTYKIELKVLARNEPAVRFYEALGYVPRVMVMSKHFKDRPH